jgi:hypothetical protein
MPGRDGYVRASELQGMSVSDNFNECDVTGAMAARI